MSDDENIYQQIIAKCWLDESFKNKLLSDPIGTLKSEGIQIPTGVSVTAVENMHDNFTLVIPPKPLDLSIEQIAGGEFPMARPRTAFTYWKGEA